MGVLRYICSISGMPLRLRYWIWEMQTQRNHPDVWCPLRLVRPLRCAHRAAVLVSVCSILAFACSRSLMRRWPSPFCQAQGKSQEAVQAAERGAFHG